MAKLDGMMVTAAQQDPQKGFQPWLVLFQKRRKLPQDRPRPLLKGLDAIEEFFQRSVQVGDLLHVGDKPAAFHSINKPGRRPASPASRHRKSRQSIERIIDLDRAELRGVELKLLGPGNLFGIKGFVPAFIRPSASADEDDSVPKICLHGSILRRSPEPRQRAKV